MFKRIHYVNINNGRVHHRQAITDNQYQYTKRSFNQSLPFSAGPWFLKKQYQFQADNICQVKRLIYSVFCGIELCDL